MMRKSAARVNSGNDESAGARLNPLPGFHEACAEPVAGVPEQDEATEKTETGDAGSKLHYSGGGKTGERMLDD